MDTSILELGLEQLAAPEFDGIMGYIPQRMELHILVE